MEETLSAKMKDFMTVLDQVKKYRELLASSVDFAIIIALSIVATLFVTIFSRLGLVFITYINPNWMPIDATVQILVFLAGITAGVFWVNRRLKSVKAGQWRSALDEGTPGAIKLLQELNWDAIFTDIRYAKLGFWLYGTAKIVAYWVLTVIVFSILANILVFAIHSNVDILVVGLVSLVLVLALNRNDLRKRFNEVGRLDALLWELRWFDSEFRRADFKA
jgi:hypothetical protein